MTLESWNYVGEEKANDNLGTFDYKELVRLPAGQLQLNEGVAENVRFYIVNWSSRIAFLNDLLGYSRLDQSNGILRYLPQPDPEIPTFYCHSAQCEPWGEPGVAQGFNGDDYLGFATNPSGRAATWTLARIVARFRPLSYDVKTDAMVANPAGGREETMRYLSRKMAPSMQLLTMQGMFLFCRTRTAIPQPPGLITGEVALQYTWHEIPGLARNPFVPPVMDAYNACIGRINSVPFDRGGLFLDPGTVLFTGMEPQMVRPRLGAVLNLPAQSNWYFEINYNFVYRRNGIGITAMTLPGPVVGPDKQTTNTAGWNYFYNPYGYKRLCRLGAGANVLKLNTTTVDDGKLVLGQRLSVTAAATDVIVLPEDTFIAGWLIFDQTRLIMSQNANLDRANQAVSFMNAFQTAQTVAGSNVITIQDTRNLSNYIGCPVIGSGIPFDSSLVSVVDGIHITINQNCTLTQALTTVELGIANGWDLASTSGDPSGQYFYQFADLNQLFVLDK